MRYRDYVTNNLWDYLKYVFNWSKYCCMFCEKDIACKILFRQPKDKPGVCQKCWDKMNKQKSSGSGARRRIRELIEQKRKDHGSQQIRSSKP